MDTSKNPATIWLNITFQENVLKYELTDNGNPSKGERLLIDRFDPVVLAEQLATWVDGKLADQELTHRDVDGIGIYGVNLISEIETSDFQNELRHAFATDTVQTEP